MTLSIETELLSLVSDICVRGAGVGCIYLLIASIVVLRFPRRSMAVSRGSMPVTILKPLHGAEPGLSRRLASFCDQEYGAPIQVLCGVQDPADPTIADVRRLGAEVAGSQLQLEINPRQHGSNRKVSNLANMLPFAAHDTLVIADSDIEVGRDYLGRIIAELQCPGVGAVSCVYHGVAAPGTWSRQAALALNSHFLPNVVVALTFGLAQPCFGSTIALRASTLARIGGLPAFANRLADDYAIGEAVRSAGHEVVIPAFSVGHACFHDRLQSLLAHELRTARTIKSIDPVGHCGSIVTHAFPLALIGTLLGAHNGVLLAVIALACRGALCLCVEHACGLPRQPYWLIPTRDLLSFAVFVLSFFGASVTWRGSSYRVSSGGELTPDRS
jgi:ceramide glucosyltransferase